MNKHQALTEIRDIVSNHRVGTAQYYIPSQDAVRIEDLARNSLLTPDRLDRIAQAAREELARIEQHGGCAGFAGRVLAMATEGDDG